MISYWFAKIHLNGYQTPTANKKIPARGYVCPAFADAGVY